MNCSIILAAGLGTRMKSSLPKILHNVLGKPMIQYVIEAHKSAGIDKVFIVLSENKLLEEFIANKYPDITVLFQDKPLGTGDAVKRVLPEITENDNYLITPGDVPLLNGAALLKFIEKSSGSISVLTTLLDNPFGYGRIIRKNGKLSKIVEERDANKEEKKVNEVNSGIFYIKGYALKKYIPLIANDNIQKEYYLTDIIKLSNDDNSDILPIIEEDSVLFQGVNTREQLVNIEMEKQKRINYEFLVNGVTIHIPNSVVIEDDVIIGNDSEIFQNSRITGKTKIGNNCLIGQNCYIESSIIGDNVVIKDNSYIENAVVGNRCIIGPMAHLRPETILSDNVHIGNFVEVKKSVIGENSKINHLTYIGDAEIGKDTNIGAGTITCNYDGFNKFKTVIGDRVFIGSDSQLVAPVTIEDDVYIGAGSTITKTVKSGSLSLTRADQKTIPGYTDRVRKRSKK